MSKTSSVVKTCTLSTDGMLSEVGPQNEGEVQGAKGSFMGEGVVLPSMLGLSKIHFCCFLK